MELKIGHLYPDLMNLYGDRGNIIALTRRCYWHDIRATVEEIKAGEEKRAADCDVVFIGGGQDREQKQVAWDLRDRQGPALRAAAAEGVVILGICGGYQLLGHEFRTGAGEVLPGTGILDLVTVGGDKRLIGNIAVVSDLLGGKTLVGFENHSGKTYLGEGAKPLGKVLAGHGNNGEDGTEGAYCKNVVGTYLHGSVLPKNPWLADYLLAKAVERRGGNYHLREVDDRLERTAHAAALHQVGVEGKMQD